MTCRATGMWTLVGALACALVAEPAWAADRPPPKRRTGTAAEARTEKRATPVDARATVQQQRRAAMENVVRPGRRGEAAALPGLLEALRTHGDPEVRARAAWSLGELGSPAAVTPLARALRDDKVRRVRRAAALALGRLDTAEARRALVAALEDPDARVASAAVEALAQSAAPGARTVLMRAAKDPRVLVALTARRALAGSAQTPEDAPTAVPQKRWQDAFRLCTDGLQPPDCMTRRERGANVRADAFMVLGGTLLGGFGGAFITDVVVPARRGTRFNTITSRQVSNETPPLQRALLAGLGAAAGAAASTLWAMVDDVSPTRAGMVALMAMEGMALGTAASLATNGGRNQLLGSALSLGVVGGVAGAFTTWVPHDFSAGDVTWVLANALMGFGAGVLGALVVIPSGVGRLAGKEGYVTDVGDLVSAQDSVYALPFGPVSRVQLAVATGLVTGVLGASLTYLGVPLYEVGVARAARTAAAALLVGGLIFLPLGLVPFQPPSPLPTTERAGAALALAGGAAAGAVAFAVSPNEDALGPLVDLGAFTGGRRSKEQRASPPAITLKVPTLGITPPLPLQPGAAAQGAGVYVGLLNGSFF